MEQKLKILVLIVCCCFYHIGIGQTLTITGTVADEQGNPLVGVTVLESGTSNGAITTLDGQYQLSVSNANAVVSFSYLGYKKVDIAVNNNDVLNVTLIADQKLLEDVVVVGYGVQKRANLTGAVSTIDTDVLDSRPITDVGRALQGVSPSLVISSPSGQIGLNPNIKLRGNVGTLGTGGGAQPLILVDNVEVTNLQAVNPQDIEDISVLKDAASTSIYGARAAWGVILITTKKGKRNEKPKVSYSNNFNWSTPTVLPDIAPSVEGAEMAFAAVNRRIPSLTSFGVVGMRIDLEAIERMRDWKEQYSGQNLGPEMVEGRDYEIRGGQLFFYRPWQPLDLFVEKWAPQSKHDLSISGGSENTNYYLGLGLLGQTGVYKTNPDEFNRYNLNLSVNTTVNDWLDVRGKVLHTNTKFTEPFKYGSNTYDAWYYTMRWPEFYPYGTVDGLPFRNHINEISQATMNTHSDSFSRLILGTTLTPIKDLQINLDYTHDRVEDHEPQVGGVLSAYNFWAQGANFSYVPYTSASFNRVIYNSDWSRRNTGKIFGVYDKSFGDHGFKLTAGGDLEEYEYWGQSSQRRDLLNLDQGELDLATGDQFVGGGRNKWATLGSFARINYDFKEKYLLELNGRYDGSSRLSRNEKWAFFPSASAGWVLTEENFMEFAQPTLSFMKLRASYGTLGNQNTSLGNIYRIMGSSNSSWLIGGNNQLTVSTPRSIPNSLTWESVSTLDFGLDSRFLNNRMGLSFDWYKRTVTDMHSSGVTLPSSYGTSSPIRNFGELQTTGYELEFDFIHQFNNKLNINGRATFSDYQEKVTKFANDTKLINSNYEGKVLGEIWGFETDRYFGSGDFIDDGSRNGVGAYGAGIPDQSIFETNGWFRYGPGDVKYKDLNGDGVIDRGSGTLEDPGDMKVIGNSTPRYQYGFQLGADWKGVDISMFMQGVGKRDEWVNGPVFIPGYRYGEAWFAHQTDYWTPENQDAYYPRPNDQQQSNNAMNFLPQSKYLLDMSYLRMKNVTVGYSLPSNILGKLKASEFRVYFSGDNLFEFTNLQLPIDPEIDYTPSGLNDSNTFGRVYPFRRMVSGGLQLSF